MKRDKDNVKIALFFVFVSFVLTMSILMSIFFAFNSYIEQKKSKTPLYVFCKNNSTYDEVEDLLNNIKAKKGVLSVKLINKQEALEEMVKKFSISSKLFRSNPFPYSIEVFFRPSFTTGEYFRHFIETLKSPIVETIKYPESVLSEIESLHSRLAYFSEVVIATLYGVEFIVFVSIMTIFYSHRKFDYDTLKFFGIKRNTILRLFLRDTLLPAVWGFLFSVIVIVTLFVLYDKYGDIPFISKELFKSSQKNTFVLNIVVGFIFTLLSALIVFFINDEKV